MSFGSDSGSSVHPLVCIIRQQFSEKATMVIICGFTKLASYPSFCLLLPCREAAMEPIRELGSRITTVELDQVRPLVYSDFTKALRVIRPSVSRDQLHRYEKWNRDFGSL